MKLSSSQKVAYPWENRLFSQTNISPTTEKEVVIDPVVLSNEAIDIPASADTSVNVFNLVSTPSNSSKMDAELHEAVTSPSETKPEPIGKSDVSCRLGSPSTDGLAGGAETLRKINSLPGGGRFVTAGGAVVEGCATPAVVRYVVVYV